MVITSKFLGNMLFERLSRVQRFRGHPPVSPKSIDTVKEVFMSNVRENWLVEVGNDRHLISAHPSLLIAIDRFADNLLAVMQNFVDSNKRGNGSYEKNLANSAALAVAQFNNQRDILGFEFDIDYMTKQVFFELAAKYQATFDENVVVDKAVINYKKSDLWLDRVNIRNNDADEYLSL